MNVLQDDRGNLLESFKRLNKTEAKTEKSFKEMRHKMKWAREEQKWIEGLTDEAWNMLRRGQDIQKQEIIRDGVNGIYIKHKFAIYAMALTAYILY